MNTKKKRRSDYTTQKVKRLRRKKKFKNEAAWEKYLEFINNLIL